MAAVIPVEPSDTALVATRATRIRHAGPAELEAALTEGRAELCALFEGFEHALGPAGLRIPRDPVLNLPLWELGHIGWFEEYWLSRHAARARGSAADPTTPRTDSMRQGADALYDSSKVPHARRWELDLPTPDETRRYLSGVREATLALLRRSDADDDALYFFRLVLLHEDMHREAWHFMAQQLGVSLGPSMRQPTFGTREVGGEMHVPAGWRRLGSEAQGFAFDNERGAHASFVPAFAIDRAPVRWRDYLPFVEAEGYARADVWSPQGRAWCERVGRPHPRHLRRSAHGWEQQLFGRWGALDLDAPVRQVTAHEADAWCRWAGRRLPTEHEWETAALLSAHSQAAPAGRFEWGEVWEWTSTPFAPYPGFAAHPYREYSQPWFDGRPVLRGGSFATSDRIRHPRFRNFFPPDRDDVFAGFRSCQA